MFDKIEIPEQRAGLEAFVDTSKLFEPIQSSKDVNKSGYSHKLYVSMIEALLKSGLSQYRKHTSASRQMTDFLSRVMHFSPEEVNLYFSTKAKIGSIRLAETIDKIAKIRGINYHFALEDAPRLNQWIVEVIQASDARNGGKLAEAFEAEALAAEASA